MCCGVDVVGDCSLSACSQWPRALAATRCLCRIRCICSAFAKPRNSRQMLNSAPSAAIARALWRDVRRSPRRQGSKRESDGLAQDCFFRDCARKTCGAVLKKSLLDAARRLELRGVRNAWPARGAPCCKPCRSKLSKEALLLRACVSFGRQRGTKRRRRPGTSRWPLILLPRARALARTRPGQGIVERLHSANSSREGFL